MEEEELHIQTKATTATIPITTCETVLPKEEKYTSSSVTHRQTEEKQCNNAFTDNYNDSNNTNNTNNTNLNNNVEKNMGIGLSPTTLTESGSVSELFGLLTVCSEDSTTSDPPNRKVKETSEAATTDEKPASNNDDHHHHHNSYQEKIQQLLYERDMAINDADTSKEMLSCVMEAVKILTVQMKKTHQMLMNQETPGNTSSSTSIPPSLQHLQLEIPSQPKQQQQMMIPSILSDLSADFTRTQSIDEGDEDDSTNNSHFVIHTDTKDDNVRDKVTLTHSNVDEQNNNNNNNKHQYQFKKDERFFHFNESSNRSVASSSVATYMSEENKRFSELLEQSSTLPYLFTQNSPSGHFNNKKSNKNKNNSSSNNASNENYNNLSNLSHVRSDLMALGHSCQMVGENANLLHNEACTFLIDLQNVNAELSKLQSKYHKAEKVAKKLYKENKKLKVDVEKSKLKNRVLVKEFKTLMDEKEIQKEFENHLLKAWDIHERMINHPKKNTLGTVEGNYHISTPGISSESKEMKNNNNYDDENPITPLSQVASSRGTTPPSSATSPGFQQMLQSCPTMDSSTDGKISLTMSALGSKVLQSRHSFSPVIQFTPTPDTIVSDKLKATLRIQDSDEFEGEDNNNDEYKRGQEVDSKDASLPKSKSSSSKMSTNSPPPKPENSFTKMFFSTNTSGVTIQNSKTSVVSVKLPPSIRPHTAPVKAISPYGKSTLQSFVSSSSPSLGSKLPPSLKVIKKKKKQLRQYKLVE